jgi:glucan phosphoethanolaminetransferase (alkaline phosphatase superfamily)
LPFDAASFDAASDVKSPFPSLGLTLRDCVILIPEDYFVLEEDVLREVVQATATDSIQWATQLPWLLMMIVAVPMLFVAWKLRIYPTKYWIALLGIGVLLSLVNVFFTQVVTLRWTP